MPLVKQIAYKPCSSATTTAEHIDQVPHAAGLPLPRQQTAYKTTHFERYRPPLPLLDQHLISFIANFFAMIDLVEMAMKRVQALMSYHFKKPGLLRNALIFEPGPYRHSPTVRDQRLVSFLSWKWFREIRYSTCMCVYSSEHLSRIMCIYVCDSLT